MLLNTILFKLLSTAPQHAEFSFTVQAQAAVDKRAEELDKQAEALAQEKQKMSAIAVADNDVLDLNVGGVLLSVKRATLTQVKCPSTLTFQKPFCRNVTLMVLNSCSYKQSALATSLA